jgi:hypothetical protein
MHTTSKMYLERLHEGTAPPSWGTGDTFFQKAKFIAATAWESIRGTDPPLADCDLSHQETCIGIAESIMSGNKPDSTPYAQAVHQLVLQLPKEAITK